LPPNNTAIWKDFAELDDEEELIPRNFSLKKVKVDSVSNPQIMLREKRNI
jgi:hypothetical protein